MPSLVLRNRTPLIENHLPEGQEIIPYYQQNENPSNSFAAVPIYYKDYIIFASSRKSEESTDYVYAWDENPYLELYESEIRDNGELFNTQVLTTNKKSNYHEGPASFSSTENVIYFTTYTA